MPLPSEVQVKEKRVRGLLEDLGYNSLIITRRDNIAWLSGGGEAVADRMSPYSPVYLVLTPDKKYAVGYSMDLPWTMDEALDGLEYEGVSLPTFGKSPDETALELAEGRIAADTPFLGVDDIDAQIIDLYLPYTPEEMDRYESLAQESAKILTELAHWVEPGMTERQAFAQMWKLYLDHNFAGMFMFVGADERIKQYRHPVPSDKPIEQVVLFAPTGVKHGLPTLSTRIVYFGEPPEDIRKRFKAMATVQAAMLTETRPGAKMNDLLNLIFDLYGELGYPEERNNHFHGGPTNYRGSYIAPMQDPDAVVQANSSFTYYLTVTGAKSEDLLLVTEQETRIASLDPDWPMLEVTYEGNTFAVPDILVR